MTASTITLLATGEYEGRPHDWGVDREANIVMERVVGGPWYVALAGYRSYRDACAALGSYLTERGATKLRFVVPVDRRLENVA